MDIKELGFANAKDVLDEVLTEIKTPNTEELIKTGYYDLDSALGGGLHNGELIVLAGRPAMGKTTLGLNIATNIAKQNIPVAVFSLKSSKEQVLNRILCNETMIDKDKVINKKLDEQDILKLEIAVKDLSEKEIIIDDTPVINVNELKQKSIKLKAEKNIGLILIDDLQFLKCNEDFKTNELMKELKELSQELNIPIIIISTLPPELERRLYIGNDARPILSDLHRDIVLNADKILFLYRDDYYNEDSEKKNIAEVIIARNKHRDTTIVELIFLDKWFKFVNLEKRDEKIEESSKRLTEKEITFKQELICIKKYTNLLDNININEVKQLKKCYWNENIYVLLNDGELYCNSVLIEKNINSIYSIDNEIDIYIISKDNRIKPLKPIEEWNDFDLNLYNENEPYKKILTYNSSIIVLTKENRVNIVSFFEFIGIRAENLIDVEDIFIKEYANDYSKVYIVKQGKEIPLYIV